MRTGLALIGALLAAAVIGTTAISHENHDVKTVDAAIKARKAQMQMYAFNLGLLGSMAKGEIDYNADAAQAAARNLAMLTKLDQSRMWPKGSDLETLGKDKTATRVGLWSADSTGREKAMALATAAMAMETAAGGGLDAMRGAIGPLGKSCGGCHELYRQK